MLHNFLLQSLLVYKWAAFQITRSFIKTIVSWLFKPILHKTEEKKLYAENVRNWKGLFWPDKVVVLVGSGPSQ